VLIFGALLLASSILLSYLIIEENVRLAVAFVFGLTIIILATLDLRLAVVSTLGYLTVMGDIRRLLISVAGWAGTDPLLLIGPAFAIVVTAYVMAGRRVHFDTTLAPWILGLMAIMILQIFNPRQGGLMIGVAGALFYIVPLLWYWIGQVYATPAFIYTVLYKVVVPLGFLAVLMGLYQVFYGYLPYQQMWFDCCAYTALGVEGKQAPISVFASAIEYSVYTIVVCIILWARFLKTKDATALLGIIPLFIAVFLIGSRGPIAQLLAVAAALWAALSSDKRTWVLRGSLAVILCGLALVVALTQISETAASLGNERVQHRMQRQADGFLNITDPNKSTATIHKQMMIEGIIDGFTTPMGYGLGATTQAAHKFAREGDDVTGVSAEVDISNIFLSTGTIGGIIYVIIVVLTIKQAVQYWSDSRMLIGLAIAGVLGVTLLNWLAGGRYALAPLTWFLIGALDRLNADFQARRSLSSEAVSTLSPQPTPSS